MDPNIWTLTPEHFFGIIFRTTVVYTLLLVGIRVTGKREVGQLTPFDFVLLLVVSNAVQNAMVGPDTSLSGGLVAMTTLLVLNSFVAKAGMRFPKFRRFVDGIPVILVWHGQIQWDNLHHENISADELLGQLREHEVTRIDQVSQAILEVDGSISVIRKESGGDLSETKYVHSHKKRRHHIRKPNG